MELNKIKPTKTILLVEDNPAHVLITKEAFQEVEREDEPYHIELVNVRDGILALQHLSYCKSKGKYPDLIMIDINLPKLNGLDLLKKIKIHKSFRVIPSIIMTNGSRGQEINEAYDRNANAFIIKPFKYDDFLEMIRLLKHFWFDFTTIVNTTLGDLHGK